MKCYRLVITEEFNVYLSSLSAISGEIASIGIITCAAMIVTIQNNRVKIPAVLAILILSVSMFLTGSRAAFFSLLVSGIFLFYQFKQLNLRKILTIFIFIGVVLLILYYIDIELPEGTLYWVVNESNGNEEFPFEFIEDRQKFINLPAD